MTSPIAIVSRVFGCAGAPLAENPSSLIASKLLDPLHSREGKGVAYSAMPITLPSLKGPLKSCLKAGADTKVWAIYISHLTSRVLVHCLLAAWCEQNNRQM